MFKKKNGIKLILLLVFFVIIAITTLAIKGNEYVLKVELRDIKNINEVIIDYSDIIEIVDKKVENNSIIIKIKSVKKGYGHLDLYYGDQSFISSIYVHSFGIISYNEFLGKITGDIIVPLLFIIYLFILVLTIIKKYRESVRKNLFQYKNIAYLGLIIFLSIIMIAEIQRLKVYNGIIFLVSDMINFFSLFSFYLLPVTLIVSIFVTISNIKLIIKAGFNWRNILGVLLGLFFIVGSIFPDFLYRFMYDSNFDIHNEKALSVYIYNFVETFIYAITAYLECVLLSTVIMGIKAARNIPKFDKDFIIILGCMINKDGSLPPLLKGRTDRAIEFAKMQKEATGKDIIFIPSGGKGDDEPISEGEAIKNYLLKQGIKEKNIIVESKSVSTYQNIKYSYNLIKDKNSNIALSTTNYHVFRAGIIASSQNILLEGIGSKTVSYFWINAFIREFIATIYFEKKRHFIIFGLIMLICLLLIGLTYIAKLL